MKRLLSLAIAFIAGPAAAQTGSPRAVETKPALGAWGVDLSNIDPSVKPGDDFYRYVNGRWLAQNRIPADRPAWGSFNELQRTSEQRVQQLIDGLATATGVAPGSDAQKVRDFYASFADEAAVNARGLAPARADLERLGRARDLRGSRGRARRSGAQHRRRRSISTATSTRKIPTAIRSRSLKAASGCRTAISICATTSNSRRFASSTPPRSRRCSRSRATPNAERNADAIVALERAIAEVSWPNADQARRGQDLQSRQSRGARRARAGLSMGRVPESRRARRSRTGSSRTRRARSRSSPRCSARRRSSTWQAYLRFHYLHAFAPYADDRARRRELRVLRHRAQQPARAAAARDARGATRELAGRRGDRPAVRREVLPAVVEGADGSARRELARRARGAHPASSIGCPMRRRPPRS